ncbi:MAG: hypothetical protein HQL64_13330 [Magnetococcales bacterium]|nr:hypothetical protein [Magnetococcales bacterium]
MSNAIAFDTLKFAKRLKEAGVPETQAEVQAELLAEALAERLASKEDVAALDGKIEVRVKELDGKIELRVAELRRDIKEVEANLKRDIKELDVKLETRLKELELRMVVKTGGMIPASIGLLFGLMRAWPLPVQYVNPPSQDMRQPLPPAPQGFIPSPGGVPFPPGRAIP